MRYVRGFTPTFLILAVSVSVFGADPPPSTRAERLASLVQTVRQAKARYHEEADRSGNDDASRAAAEDRRRRVEVEAAEAALTLALADPDDAVASEALRFVVRTESHSVGEPTKSATRAMEILASRHAGEPGMGALCGDNLQRFFELPAAESLIRSVLERNPSREERAAACLELAGHLRSQASRLRRLRDRPQIRALFERVRGKELIDRFLQKDPDALDQEADAALERAASEFGDVATARGAMREIALGLLQARRSLAIGSVAPEIEGRDHEGALFRLSDYRGRIVVLTFSGNWCAPCRNLYPRERELVRKMPEQSFALLSVDTDEEVRTLRESIASGEITWKCWWDGDERPISTRWGVQSFPKIYVIDHHGVIRSKPSRLENLEEIVEKLAAELPKREP